MQVSALGNLGVAGVGSPGNLSRTGMAVGGAPFGDLLANAIESVAAAEQQAASAVEGLLSGSGADIHAAMVATQKADLSFEMALAVRNKAVAAYQQVMGMQF